jgi:hypothetical protein
VAAVTADLEVYRREAEAFVSARDEALYRHYAGLTADLPLAALYERHADLYTAEAAAALRAEAAQARGDAGRGLRMLAEFAAGEHLEAATRDRADALARAEAEATVRLDGRDLAYREAAIALANEPDRPRRRRLEAARQAVVEQTLNPFHVEIWSQRHALARELGAASYRDLVEGLAGIDLDALAAQCRTLLDDTEELYAREMDRALRTTAGVTLAEAARSDLPRLMRAVGFDPHFPGDRLVPALARSLEGMGIDLARQANVVVDIEPRPGKDPRAFCAPVAVPDRVYLVVYPRGGVDDYHAVFHEAGHTEHYANVGRELRFEFRYLGDASVTECYAFLLEGLTRDPVWLAGVLDYREPEDYVRHVALIRLLQHRRYAAKLLYELGLHADGGLDGAADRYTELLSAAVGFEWPSQLYLADVDPGFYAARYLRAWALETSLRGYLRERFGTRWYAVRRAGGLLRELWHEGQRLDGDEIAGELDLPSVDLAVLSDEAHALLG